MQEKPNWKPFFSTICWYYYYTIKPSFCQEKQSKYQEKSSIFGTSFDLLSINFESHF